MTYEDYCSNFKQFIQQQDFHFKCIHLASNKSQVNLENKQYILLTEYQANIPYFIIWHSI